MCTIRIPSTMRALTGGRSEVEVPGETVVEALTELERLHPGIRAQLFDPKGALRRYLNVFLNEEDIRFLDGLDTPITKTDRITLVPAMAGG